MKTHSAKNKGRKLQQWVRDLIIEGFNLDLKDVQSTSMGAGGMDVKLSTAAAEKFPFAIECKNAERVNIWEAYKQASANCEDLEPLVVIKRNHHKPLVVLDAEFFINLVGDR